MDFSAVPPPDPEIAPQQNQPAPGFTSRIFQNETGIRSGWRILIYLALALLFFALAYIPIIALYQPHDANSVGAILTGEAAMFAGAFGAAVAMARIEQRPIGTYGMPLYSAFAKRFWQGMLIGICEISLIVGAMKFFGCYSFGSLSFHGAKIVEWGLLWILTAVLIGLQEEFLFRGYMQYTLADGIGFWPSAVALSVLFGSVHLLNHGENWVGAANIFFTALVWAFTLRRTGTLWLAVGWHAAFDFGESFLYSVPDSGGVFEGHLSNAVVRGPAWLTGGKVGPEASVFAFLTLVLGVVLIHFWFPAPPKTQTNT
jgi:uncharacterized protein